MSRLPFELTIPKPCSQQWSEMPGSTAMRHCASCDTPVHNLAVLTPRQIERLVFESGGHLCGRITRKLNGDMVVSRPETNLRIGAALLMAAALATVPADSLAQQDAADLSGEQATQRQPTACIADPGALAGVVTDSQGALVVGADITLVLQGQSVASTKSNNAGCFQFAVAPGNYEVAVSAQGFAMRSKAISFGNTSPRVNEISLQPGTQVNIQVTALDPASYALTGALAITYTHWYQRFGYRVRHPIAYFKYKLHHT